jgi:hypothetical protein
LKTSFELAMLGRIRSVGAEGKAFLAMPERTLAAHRNPYNSRSRFQPKQASGRKMSILVRSRTGPRKHGEDVVSVVTTARQTAHFPTDLQHVIHAWPLLPQRVRAEIAAIVNVAVVDAAGSG